MEDEEAFAVALQEHARYLGLDPDKHPDLLPLVEESLRAAVPEGWTESTDQESGAVYYFNQSTGASLWEHPDDFSYREKIKAILASLEASGSHASIPTLDAPHAPISHCKKLGDAPLAVEPVAVAGSSHDSESDSDDLEELFSSSLRAQRAGATGAERGASKVTDTVDSSTRRDFGSLQMLPVKAVSIAVASHPPQGRQPDVQPPLEDERCMRVGQSAQNWSSPKLRRALDSGLDYGAWPTPDSDALNESTATDASSTRQLAALPARQAGPPDKSLHNASPDSGGGQRVLQEEASRAEEEIPDVPAAAVPSSSHADDRCIGSDVSNQTEVAVESVSSIPLKPCTTATAGDSLTRAPDVPLAAPVFPCNPDGQFIGVSSSPEAPGSPAFQTPPPDQAAPPSSPSTFFAEITPALGPANAHLASPCDAGAPLQSPQPLLSSSVVALDIGRCISTTAPQLSLSGGTTASDSVCNPSGCGTQLVGASLSWVDDDADGIDRNRLEPSEQLQVPELVSRSVHLELEAARARNRALELELDAAVSAGATALESSAQDAQRHNIVAGALEAKLAAAEDRAVRAEQAVSELQARLAAAATDRSAMNDANRAAAERSSAIESSFQAELAAAEDRAVRAERAVFELQARLAAAATDHSAVLEAVKRDLLSSHSAALLSVRSSHKAEEQETREKFSRLEASHILALTSLRQELADARAAFDAKCEQSARDVRNAVIDATRHVQLELASTQERLARVEAQAAVQRAETERLLDASQRALAEAESRAVEAGVALEHARRSEARAVHASEDAAERANQHAKRLKLAQSEAESAVELERELQRRLAAADDTITGLRSALAASDLSASQATAAADAARSLTAGTLKDCDSRLAAQQLRHEQQIAAAVGTAKREVEAEARTMLALKVSDLTVKLDRETRRAAAAEDALRISEAALTSRVHDMELRASAVSDTLQSEIGRLVQSNASLISQLERASIAAAAVHSAATFGSARDRASDPALETVQLQLSALATELGDLRSTMRTPRRTQEFGERRIATSFTTPVHAHPQDGAWYRPGYWASKYGHSAIRQR
jgi:hypothetical protein